MLTKTQLEIAKESSKIGMEIYNRYLSDKDNDVYIMNLLSIAATLGTCLSGKKHPIIRNLADSLGMFTTITIASIEHKRNNQANDEQSNTTK